MKGNIIKYKHFRYSNSDELYCIKKKVEYRNFFGCLTKITWEYESYSLLTKNQAEIISQYLNDQLKY